MICIHYALVTSSWFYHPSLTGLHWHVPCSAGCTLVVRRLHVQPPFKLPNPRVLKGNRKILGFNMIPFPQFPIDVASRNA